MFESLKKSSRAAGKATDAPRQRSRRDRPRSGRGGRQRPEDPRGSRRLLWELELGLLESDVALPVIEEIKSGVREGLVGRRVDRKFTLENVVEAALKSAIEKVLKKSEFDFDAFVREHQKPVVIMFVGINGTGKTTAIAKISNRLQKMGLTTVLSASDTFRAGAIEQLNVHADRLGTKIVKHQSGGDPAAVAYDAVDHAKAKRRDVVLVDTAGRMQTNINLMDEMKKIKRVVSPHLIVFVASRGTMPYEGRAFDRRWGSMPYPDRLTPTPREGRASIATPSAGPCLPVHRTAYRTHQVRQPWNAGPLFSTKGPVPRTAGRMAHPLRSGSGLQRTEGGAGASSSSRGLSGTAPVPLAQASVVRLGLLERSRVAEVG